MLQVDDHFRRMYSLAKETEKYHHQPNTFGLQAFKDFESLLTVLTAEPEYLTFVGARTQPDEEIRVINDYTNSYMSRAASSCDGAIDHFVLYE